MAGAWRQPPGKEATLGGEVYGFDGGKLIKGRKRFILVDTLGLLLGVIVTEANFPERLGGVVVTMEAAQLTQNLVLIWVDASFSGDNFARVMVQVCRAKVEVVRRSQSDFQVLPKRWIVERNKCLVESISSSK